MGKHSPVADRIALAKAKLAALMAKEAKSEINSNPAIQKIDEHMKAIQNDMLKYNRWASEGEEKIANFEARAQEWKERLEEAVVRRGKAAEQMDALRSERKKLSGELVKEMGIEA